MKFPDAKKTKIERRLLNDCCNIMETPTYYNFHQQLYRYFNAKEKQRRHSEREKHKKKIKVETFM